MKHKRLFVDATVYTLAGYLVQPLTIVSSLLVKGSIGPYLTGVMGTLNLFLYYASFSHLGVLNAAERDLPFCLGSGDADRFDRIRYSTFTTTLVSALVFASGMAGWALLSRSALDEPLFIGTLVYVVYVVGWSWSAYYITLLRTYQEFVFLSKVQVVVGTVASIGNIVAVILFGFWGLLGMTVAVNLFQVALVTRRVGYISRLQIDWPEFRRLLFVGVPLLIFGLAMTGIKTVDNILVLQLLGTEALGLYSIALLANTAIFSVTNSLSGVLYPRMQKAYGSDPTVRSLSVYVIRPSMIMGILLPFVISALFLGTPAVVYWLLPRFASGILPFKVIAVSTYFFAMFPMSANFLIALNKQLKVVALLFVAIGLVAALGLLFVRLGWGLMGIALAVAGGYVFCFVSINAYALYHWASWREIASFLRDLTIPIAYAAILLIMLDQYSVSVGSGVLPVFGVILAKLIVFSVAYLPLLLWLERKTHLISDIAQPAVEHLLRLASTP